MQPEIEYRILPDAGIELRSEEGKAPKLRGYAAVFNVESEDFGGFREMVMPGAFERGIKDKVNVFARTQHNSQMLLGSTDSGTLRLWTDERGLGYEIDVPDTTAGRDTLEYVRRGDIKHSSFAFHTKSAGTRWEKRSGQAIRQLVDVDLVDVGPVIGPAYKQTEVSARALDEARQIIAEELAPGVPNEVNEARLRLVFGR